MAWGLTLRSCTRLHQRVLHAVIDGDGQVGGHRPRRGRPHRQRRVGYTPLPQGIGHVGPCAQHCTHVKARPIAAELVCHGIPRATWACDSSNLRQLLTAAVTKGVETLQRTHEWGRTVSKDRTEGLHGQRHVDAARGVTVRILQLLRRCIQHIVGMACTNLW